jgi:hypothetical protein
MSELKLDMSFQGFDDAQWERFFYFVGEEVRNIVLRRIQDGMGVDGVPLLDGALDKYSPGYEARKKAMGRDPYSSGDRFVLSGDMLAGFDVTDHGVEFVEIGFTDNNLAARAFSNDERRPTFAVTAEEVEVAFSAAWEKIFQTNEEE